MEWRVRESFQPQAAIDGSANPMLRLFTVQKVTAGEPQKTVKTTGWHECGPASVKDFSAVGYFFGRDLQKSLNIPVGLIHTSWGGTPAQAWTSKESLDAVPELRHYHERLAKASEDSNPARAAKTTKRLSRNGKPTSSKAKEDGKPEPRKPNQPSDPARIQTPPSTLYNAMLAPLVPFAVRGAIWYQGESNAGSAYEYRTLFPTMIADWRRHWNYDMPFLAVQFAPFMKINPEPMDSAWAELREAQLHGDAEAPERRHGRHHRCRRGKRHSSEEEGTGRRSTGLARRGGSPTVSRSSPMDRLITACASKAIERSSTSTISAAGSNAAATS